MKKLFEGIRVIDFGNNVAGPLTVAMMADFGADVIKVEKPGVGDDSRGFSPRIEGHSLSNLWLNRGKRSITLDVKTAEGKKLFLELVRSADVFLESSRPGVMQRLGFHYEALKEINPRLIMCSISGFGQTGPYKDLPGYDMIAQAASALMFVNGFAEMPPTRIGPSIADYCCAYNGFGAISAALFYRERTGIGQHIDLSIAECAIALNDHIPSGFLNPKIMRTGNHHALMGPYGVFNGREGSIALGAINPNLWGKLCKVMGKEEYTDKPGFATAGERAQSESLPKVIELIEGWLNEVGDIKEAERQLREQGIPCFKIMTLQELKDDPHFLERGMIAPLKTPQLTVKTVLARGNQIHMSETPGEMGVPPELNEHAEEIVCGVLGYSKEEYEALTETGAFGKNK